jgi:DNA repair exonuclease SbcCD ATPase subunit
MFTQNKYVALSYMSEIFELPEEVEEVKDLEEPKEKMVRKKKEMSAERKAVILEQLKRGRETARKNRQKKALANKITKQKERVKIDDVIKQEITTENNTDDKLTKLQKEIEELKNKIGVFTQPKLEMKIEKLEQKKEKLEQKEPTLQEKMMEHIIKTEQARQAHPPPPVEKPVEKIVQRVAPTPKVEPEPKSDEPYVPRRYNFAETLASVNKFSEEEVDVSLFKPSAW